MNAQQCHREDELLDALGRGFVGAELDSHIASCDACSELRLVAGALLADRADAVMTAPVPASGTMWWRMQLRQRQEAASTARRSLLVGQAVTLLIAVGLVILFLGADVAGELREARNVLATIRVSTTILIAVATWAIVTPIAGWVAIRQK